MQTSFKCVEKNYKTVIINSVNYKQKIVNGVRYLFYWGTPV